MKKKVSEKISCTVQKILFTEMEKKQAYYWKTSGTPYFFSIGILTHTNAVLNIFLLLKITNFTDVLDFDRSEGPIIFFNTFWYTQIYPYVSYVTHSYMVSKDQKFHLAGTQLRFGQELRRGRVGSYYLTITRNRFSRRRQMWPTDDGVRIVSASNSILQHSDRLARFLTVEQ